MRERRSLWPDWSTLVGFETSLSTAVDKAGARLSDKVEVVSNLRSVFIVKAFKVFEPSLLVD